MELTTLIVRNSLVLLGGIFVFSSLQAAQTKPAAARITQAIDEKNLVQLRGNVHPLARAEFDQGAAPADLPMQRMLLVLKRSAEQQSALQQFTIDQYNAA